MPCASPSSARLELRPQQTEIALDALLTADHHVVGTGDAVSRNNLAGELAEAALHAVAHDCAADLLGDGEADAHRRVRILAVADEEDEAGGGHAPAAVRGEEIGAFLDRD